MHLAVSRRYVKGFISYYVSSQNENKVANGYVINRYTWGYNMHFALCWEVLSHYTPPKCVSSGDGTRIKLKNIKDHIDFQLIDNSYWNLCGWEAKTMIGCPLTFTAPSSGDISNHWNHVVSLSIIKSFVLMYNTNIKWPTLTL